jgi:hypothetical protein
MFGLLCALPTSATLTAIVARQTPWYTQHQRAVWEQRISQWCGIEVRIGEWSPLAPGAHEFRDLTLFDQETGAPIGRIRLVQCALTNGRLAIRVEQPEVQTARLSELWRCLHDQLLCQPSRLAVPIGMVAHDLTLEGQLASTTLAEVKAMVERAPHETVAHVQCVVAQGDPQQPIQWQIRRQAEATQPTTRWQLTAAAALPCQFLTDYLPELELLGTQATFQGQMGYIAAADHWELDLSGSRWEQVEFARLFDRQAQRITGSGAIVVDRMMLRNGRLIDAEARVWVGPGLLSRSLLERVAKQWPSELLVEPAETDTTVAFDRLAVWLQVQGAELRLGGLCGTGPDEQQLPAHTVLARAGQPLLRVAPQQAVPVLSIASLLAPAYAVDVPRSSTTERLVDLLMAPGPDFTQQAPSTPAVWMARQRDP